MNVSTQSSLWHHPDFLKFWLGQTISGFGSRFTTLALPLMAITTLDATVAELGILTGAAGLPWLLIAPFIGVGIDRLRRRPILMVADIGRAILLVTIPIAAWLGVLQIEHLYGIAFMNGLLHAWFDTAYQAYLPSLVGRTQLVEGNSKLNISSSAADVAGPSIAGVFIQVLTAPLALAVDAFSFVVSAISIGLIQTPEPKPRLGQHQPFGVALIEGIRYIWQQAILRAFTGTNATFMFCFGIAQTVLLLFFTETLALSESMIGLIFGIGGIGGLIGAGLASWVSSRLGVGITIIVASILRGAGLATVPLAAILPATFTPWFIAIVYTIHQCGWSIWGVTQASVRQGLSPHHLRGRITAGFLAVVRSATPLGAFVGGWLGVQFGVVSTFVMAGVGLVLATGWLLGASLWQVREPPLPLDESEM
ncbi:MAG: MFS transporter [Chloroflexota bacterium]